MFVPRKSNPNKFFWLSLACREEEMGVGGLLTLLFSFEFKTKIWKPLRDNTCNSKKDERLKSASMVLPLYVIPS